VAGCGGTDAKVEYLWSMISSTNIGETITFTPAELKKSALIFDPYMLLPNSGYQFMVTVNSYTFSTSIVTGIDVIFASAGASRSIGQSNEIILSADIQDSAYKNIDFSIFTCSWLCVNLATDKGCVIATTGVALSIPNCFDNDLTGLMKTGSFKFAVTVQNMLTLASAVGEPSYLEVKNGQVPLVAIKSSELSPSSGSANFNLRSVVDPNTVTGAVSYQWSMESECFGISYLSIDLIQGTTIKTNPKKANLKFVPGVLAPAASYCIRMTVTDPANPTNPGIASLIVNVRTAPFAGTCEAKETSGTAFATKFIFRCTGWVTDPLSYPINYIFLMKTPNETEWNIIRPQRSSSVLQTRLSAGSYEIRPVVIDATQATNLKEMLIKVEVGTGELKKRSLFSTERWLGKRATSSNCEAGNDFIQESCVSFINTNNIDSIILDLAVAANGLPITLNKVDLSDDKCLDFQQKILGCLNIVLDSETWFLDMNRAGPFIASLMLSINKGNEITTTGTGAELLGLLKTTTSLLLLNSQSSCYDTATATNFLSILAPLLSSPDFYVLDNVDEWQIALKSITDCMIQNQICGQSPFEFDSDGVFSHSFGLQNSELSSSFCGFTVDSFGTSVESTDLECLRFQCLRYPQTGVANMASLIAQDSNNVEISALYSIDFLSTDGSILELQQSEIKGSISFDREFNSKYGLEGYNPQSTDNNSHILVSALLEYPDDTLSNANYSTAGIKIGVSPINGVASFTSNRTGAFFVIGKSPSL
jgi:hypothetical protein